MKSLNIPVNMTKASLCLDFANMVTWHASEQPIEHLNSYSDLVNWARKSNLISPARANELTALARRLPTQAEATLKHAIEIREAIYRLLSAHAHGQKFDPADLDFINQTLTSYLKREQIKGTNDGFKWAWVDDETALDVMLWPVVRSAADLLTTPELLSRVGECADDRGCGYLFLDLSKNQSRRWCDINDCGNRAKQRRHYQRTRSKGS